jgi:hypothetical protein
MHKYHSLLSILLIVSLSSFSQSRLTEKETKSLLCHKWKTVSIEIQGEKEPQDDDLYITFLEDGTFIDSEEGDKRSKEKWIYNHKTRTITTGDVLKKILTINEKELKLSTTMDGQNMIITLKRVD